jgi:arginine/ornithine permease
MSTEGKNGDVYQIKAELEEKGAKLKRDLKGRHLFMISIGGVIGTGLFVGSGYSISQAGPLGAVLVYALTGVIMFITMRCLGEMSVFMPVAGSFQVYATKFVSPGAGFSVGWFYWLNYAITVPFEVVISGQMMTRWVSAEIVPVWVWGTIFAVVFVALNIFAVKYFGEAEFWFCSVKVFAIIIFIILGVCQLLGILGTAESQAGFGNFLVDGTLFPTSFGMVMTAFITVAFSYNGTEIIGLTAGESSDPTKQLKKSVNNTAYRTLVFYVGSILVLVATVPYKNFVGVEFEESPFIMSLQNIGLPYAGDIMNFVVITAALSCGNSLLYSCMRLLLGMADERQAPKFLSKVTKGGVPRNALIFTMAIVCLYQLTEVFQPAFVALLLVAISSLAGMINWAFICLSQIRFRKQFVKSGGNIDDLKFKMFGYPYVPYIGLVLNLAMILSFVFLPGNLSMLFYFVPAFLIMWIGYDIFYKKRIKNRERLAD